MHHHTSLQLLPIFIIIIVVKLVVAKQICRYVCVYIKNNFYLLKKIKKNWQYIPAFQDKENNECRDHI